ncbi:MAG: hypothetical protein L0H93_10925 [Nocardioides sp.]|nr:hypothetical protein [Nocardioides sp.]
MSRQFSASSALQAAVSAVLVIAALLLLVVSGQHGDEEHSSADKDTSGTPVGVQDVSVLDLSDGFEPIPAQDFFSAVSGAQKEAGTWRVVSTSESGGQALAPSTQDVSVRPGGVNVRIAM